MGLKDILRMIFGGSRPVPPAPPPVVPPPPPPPVETGPAVAELLDLHNKTRAVYGLPPLVIDLKLQAAAESHAVWMVRNNSLSHTGIGGSTVGTRVNKAGYVWMGVGENIAAGQPTPADVVRAWMKSPGHKENILGNYKNVGFGFARDAQGRVWWCVDFARPRTQTNSVVVEIPEIHCPGGIWED